MNKKQSAAAHSYTRLLVIIFIGLLVAGLSLTGLRPARVKAQEEIPQAPSIIVFSESFDSVAPPALPAGWTTAITGQIDLFKTVTSFPDSPPNAAFVNDPETQGTSELVSPSIALGNFQHKLIFRNFYQTDFLFDGCILEISINGGAFQDIIAAGGTFLAGGYNAVTSNGSFGSRNSWTGQQAGYITTEVNLPPGTANQSVRFRWRIGTDPMEGGTGWWIDNVQVTNAISGTNAGAIAIPANGTAAPYPSEINIAGHEGLVTDVQVNLINFSHNSPDDVDLMLVAPNGNKVVLMSDVGGGNPVNNLNLLISDAAPASLPDSTAIVSGSYKPTNFELGDAFPGPAPVGAPTGNRLSALNGSVANGTWQLYLVDDNGNNAGSINGGWLIFIQSSANAIGIPESGTATPYAAQKTIAGVLGTVTKVTVTLSNFSHTSPDDVDVMLVAPNGRRIVLMSDVGGTTEVGGLNLTFDDAAPNNLPDNSQLASGLYKPTDFELGDVFPLPAPQGATTGTTLDAFYGSAPTGIWKLFIVDDSGNNAGSIGGSWNLNLQTSTTACAFSLTPSGQAFPITGGSSNFAINMPTNCSWTATTNAGFITINSGTSGTGDGAIGYSVAPNMEGGRSGTIDISNGVITRTFQVQQPSGCPFSLNQSTLNFGASGGNGNVGVTAGSTCGWAATPSANWIQITSVNPQNGDGTVTFTVQPNPGFLPRSGTVTVGARSLTINQTGANSRKFDFDADGKDDVSVFRPAGGEWYLLQSTAGLRGVQFGLNGDRIAPGDYDGDAKADIAVWRPTGGWYILNSTNNSIRAAQFGQNGDIPSPGDFDGDGKTDIGVFRPTTGTFYLLLSSTNNVQTQAWGANGDVPLMGDYDGDGKTDFAVFRPSSSIFYVLQSSNGVIRGQQWGTTGDKPIAADFDGDNKADIAVYRPSNGSWYYTRSTDNGFSAVAWGTAGDIPVAGDYDGDNKADVAVFRPSSGTFYILLSTTNALRAEQFGLNGDTPVPSAYVP